MAKTGRHKRGYSKKRVLEAIAGSRGIVSNVAKELQCDWHTADRYIKEYPEAVQAIAEESEAMLDTAENKAYELMENGDGAMVRFYLSTKGRKRGYITDDRQTQEVGNGDSVVKVVIEDGTK